MKKALLTIFTVALVYSLTYGVARWRKFIVMGEFDWKEKHLVVRETRVGWDVRDNWRGHAKNRFSPYVYAFFLPWRSIEDHTRGFRRPVPDATPTI
jgi:hypothetical protein